MANFIRSQNSSTFTANPKVEACFVFGSAVLGISDQSSDLELAFIWSQLPSAEELQATAQSFGVEGWKTEQYGEAKQGWLEQFYMYGMKVKANHWAREMIDNIVIDVVEHYDVYLAIANIAKKWTMPIRDWKPALNHFVIEFGDRIPL